MAKLVAEKILTEPLYVAKGVPLLYQVTVDNTLSITVDVKKPVRGRSSFQTDLCILERKANGISLPRYLAAIKKLTGGKIFE